MQPSCQLNWSELYDNMAKFQLRRAVEFQNIGAQLDGQQAQFLSDVNAIFLDMSPILSLTSTLDDSRTSSSDVTGLFDSLVQQLPNTLNEELDLLGPFSPLEANDWNNCLELDLDGTSVDNGGFAAVSKDVMGDGNAVHGGSGGDDGGPTLAELNYDTEALDDLDLENLSLPEENNCFVRGSSNLPTPTHDECLGLPPPTICENRSQSSSVAVAPIAIASSAVAVNSAAAVVPNSVGEQIEPVEDIPKSALHALLVRCRESRDGARNACVSSGSCDDQVAYPKIKEEPLPVVEKSGHEQRLVPNIRSQCGARLSTSSVDTLLDVKELNAKDADSHDEGFDSDLEDSDHYDFSDADSDNSWTGEQASRYDDRDQSNKQRKKERFFWQYNLQAKGPKGTRLPLAADSLDPHTLDEVTDPVFSPSCQVKGIKHTGKARRGDGNDLNPNPAKLFHIGRELKKLNKVINDLTPVSELPFNVRPKSRKEKNKLASRACRLKKKAQHEANKLKLYGLDHEHRRLMHVLDEVKKSVLKRTSAKKESSVHSSSGKLTEQCELLSKTFLKTEVAGRTADFVNLVLDKVATGVPIDAIDQL